MATISTLGVGSGIDIRSLVDGLVSAERDPKVARFDAVEADTQAGISAFGTLKAAVGELDDALNGISDLSDFKRRTATSGDEEFFTASASGLAVSGNYNIEVVSLANNDKLSTGVLSTTAELGTGQLEINVGSESFSITIDDTNNTLAGIQGAINSDPNNKGVTASLVTDDTGAKLVFTANDTGTDNAITISATDDDAGDGFDLTQLDSANLTPLVTLTDAVIKLDGLTITRSSNTIEDALEGVTINLVKANELGADETNSLSIALDKESVKNSVNSFVEAYNSFIGISNELSKFNGAGAANGPLFGDSTLRTLETQLRRELTGAVADNSIGNLTELGITTDENGLLVLDDTKLSDALENNFEDIGGLLSGEDGIANKLRDVTRNYKGFSGIIQDRTNTLTDQLDDIGVDRRELKTKMEAYEIRLIDRFIIMDQLVNSMKNTGDFVLQQLGSLNGNDDN
jgi:flagellar hook-associated protein 2